MKASPCSLPRLTAALVAAGWVSVGHAQIQSAGALFVNVDATVAPVGLVTAIPNTGTLGGFFEARGGGATLPRVALTGSSGVRGLQFDGVSYLQHVSSLQGPILPAPPGLVGLDPACSIEVWALNPTIDTEETLLSWGRRGGPDGSNMSFNYGTSAAFGAVGHWGNPDIGWNNAGGAPAANRWHHLVYTYDGTTTRVYADGVLQNSEVLGSGVINTASGTPISLGTQLEADGTTPTATLRGSLTIARVRIHDGVLNDAQVLNNYDVEKGTFADPVAGPLTAPPAHRYSFSEPAAPNAGGLSFVDSIGNANGIVRGAGASLTGSRLTLPGGASTTAAYGDLPNGLLSVNSSDNGGTGEVTLEAWAVITGNRSNARLFDFGSSAGGEVGGPGGGGAAVDSLALYAQVGAVTATRRLELRQSDQAPGSTNSADYATATFNTLIHLAVTWKESTGELRVYENGLPVAILSTPERMSRIGDVNNWLGRGNNSADLNAQLELDEFRIYNRVLDRGELFGNFQLGAAVLNLAGPVAIYAQPAGQAGVEGTTVTLSVGAGGTPPLTYQWRRGGAPISAATNATYSFLCALGDNGATFSCACSNFVAGLGHLAVSSDAVVSVVADTAAPVLLAGAALGPTIVQAQFNERLAVSPVGNLANYSLAGPGGPLPIAGATLDSTLTNIQLTLASPFTLTHGAGYTLSVSGVRDASSKSNLIAAGSSVSFTADTRPRLGGAVLSHRWSFNEPAAADATGLGFVDSISGSNGVVRGAGASFSGTRLVLAGGPSATAAYGDLPNRLLSRNGTNNGGPGGITIEGWVKITGGRTWSRLFDFGSTTGGEVTGPGGGGTGLDYLFVSAQIGDDTGNRRMETRNEDPAGGGTVTVDFPSATFSQDFHFVVTWDERTGVVREYENGVLKASLTTDDRLSEINDVNMWLGRSNWSADQNTQGEFDEFRIYAGVFGSNEVAATFAYGPERFPTTGPAQIAVQPADLTVGELQPATFSAEVGGFPAPLVQWLKNGVPVPGATNLSYTLPEALLADHGAVFSLFASNLIGAVAYGTVSSNAVLSVVADTAGPLLVSAGAVAFHSLTVVDGAQVQFNEGVQAASATNVSNYTLTGPGGNIPLLGAALDSTRRVVALAASAPLVEGATYLVRVGGVRDRSAAANLIAPNSQVSFVAVAFALRTVGVLTASNSFALVSGGYDINGAGRDIGAAGDDFAFHSQSRSGDFDVQVRLDALGPADGYSEAGLMAREGLGTNGLFAAVLASPSLGGVKFQARASVGAAASSAGSMPVNYPFTWLRLRRVENTFTGFGSLDGQTWLQLGSVDIPMGAQVLLGFAVSSHDPAATVATRFRDPANATGTNIVASLALPFEPLGPSSRRSGLTFSEIMYHPAELPGVTNSLEYIEIFNGQDYVEDLTGFRLDGDVHYKFPPGTLLPSGGFLVVARDPAGIQSVYGLAGVLGPFRSETNLVGGTPLVTTESLPNSRGTVRLENESGAHLIEVNYDSEGEWPPAADGAGHSLVLARPSYGENNPKAWAASEFIGGSPGRRETYRAEPQRSVVINEFLAHTDFPQPDAIELFNRGPQPADLSGCWLSDDFGTNKYRIADGTVLAPRAFLAFTEAQLGFSLSSDGEELLLVNSNRTRVLDAVRFGGQENGVAAGRYPDGAATFCRLAAPTLGTNNAACRGSDIVINEIMYHPITGRDDDEYLELYNRSPGSVNVGGWRLTDGITYTIPAGTTMAAGGYLVVAKNRTNLLARYPTLAANPSIVVGDFNGQLANGGEHLALAIPDLNIRTNSAGAPVTNIFYIVVNEVTYGDGGRWGQWSDGGGSSLELIDPRADNRLAANWADSDETQKAPWTLLERTAVIDLGMNTTGNGRPDRVEVLLQGAGECLVDDLEARNNGGPNRIGDPGFESGGAGWVFQGTHVRSAVENTGAHGGVNCLHLRATERGDAGANRIRTAIALMTVGGANQATLRGYFRWLRGDTNLLLRFRGQWMECAGAMTVPANLGTPGAPNSRRVANAGPAVYDVAHAPILPAANEPVVVTARVADPDGVAALTLRYRVDPATSFAEVAMRDDGAGGDAVAGDGLWSATLPGRPAGSLVAFHLRATDSNVSPATTTFPADAPAREGHVLFGETLRPGTIGTYRLWVTQSNLNYWAARERNSNEGLDCTFVYGNWRVIYNASTLYSGSPFHTPNYSGPLGAVCDYEVNLPKDDPFLGTTDFVLNGQDGVFSFFNNDVSAQAETTAYWMGRKLGLGINHKRHVFVSLNGQARGMIYFDHQQPSSEIIEEYFPDDPDGRLHKIEDWFEFDDPAGGFDYVTATLGNFLVGGQKRTERYRWMFRPRAGAPPNEYSDIFALADAATAPGPEPFTSAMLGQADMRVWMRTWALQHAIGNWDSWGYRRGKNMYAYQPTRGPWRLVLWDLDLVLGKQGDGPTQPLFDTSGADGDPAVARMFTHPPFVREFWCAMRELVDGPMLPAGYNPLVDARYAAFRANDVPVESPDAMKAWIGDRRAFILSQIPNAPFSITTTNTSATSNTFLLSGTAPVTGKQILVNGAAYPITWTSVSNWTLRVPLGLTGANPLVTTVTDPAGNVLGRATNTVNYAGTVPDPAGNVVINEIMFNPPVDLISFVELFNNHTNYAFDLSNWRVNGLSYSFPAGAVLPPRSFLVLGRSRGEYARLFGGLTPFFAQFDGSLDNGGETLTLLRPGAAPAGEIVVDKVKYESRAPWPPGARGRGASLQLIDPTQDNSRVSNWTDALGWRFFSFTGILGGNRLLLYLETPGNLYLDDFSIVAGPVPGVGTNYIVNGGFESPLAPAWKLLGTNGTNSASSPAARRSGDLGLDLRFNPAGNSGQYFYQDLSNTTATATYTLSFWYLPSTNAGNLVWRVGSPFRGSLNVRASSGPLSITATPGTTNTVSLAVAPYPAIWLNEVLPVNTTGLTNSAGERAPWLELHNSGAGILALDDWSLSDDYVDLARWRFPAGATLQPGEFKLIFADGRTDLATATEWHTSFRLAGPSGSVALCRPAGGAAQIVDYLNFDNLAPNRSYGSCPDGQLFDRQELFFATPGGPNNCAAAPLALYINEWMAANSGFIRDPADTDADDWFELYNPAAVPVDLGGLFLTDDLLNPLQYQVPNNPRYTIPPGGFLLVWADGEPGQNQTNRPDLHVSFNLRAGGEAIGLFAADGTRIDAVTFGPQAANVSEGRFPDGAASIVSMTTPTPRAPNVFAGAPTPPQIGGLTLLPGGQVRFSFTAASGHLYQVFYKDDLNQPAWLPLGPAQAGSGATIVITDNLGASPQRFYEVQVR